MEDESEALDSLMKISTFMKINRNQQVIYFVFGTTILRGLWRNLQFHFESNSICMRSERENDSFGFL